MFFLKPGLSEETNIYRQLSNRLAVVSGLTHFVRNLSRGHGSRLQPLVVLLGFKQINNWSAVDCSTKASQMNEGWGSLSTSG